MGKQMFPPSNFPQSFILKDIAKQSFILKDIAKFPVQDAQFVRQVSCDEMIMADNSYDDLIITAIRLLEHVLPCLFTLRCLICKIGRL